jgi:hypothetical protein
MAGKRPIVACNLYVGQYMVALNLYISREV